MVEKQTMRHYDSTSLKYNLEKKHFKHYLQNHTMRQKKRTTAFHLPTSIANPHLLGIVCI